MSLGGLGRSWFVGREGKWKVMAEGWGSASSGMGLEKVGMYLR
jgi:hypothetical protein